MAMGCAPTLPPLPLPQPGWPPPRTLAEAFSALEPAGAPARVTLLSDNARAWAARWRLLREARARIDVVSFIVDEDVFGLSLLGALIAGAERGVDVRLLVDARGTSRLSAAWLGLAYLDELAREAHARVHIYNPPFERSLEALLKLSLVPTATSNHDKILLVDGTHAIMGGRNIGEHYFSSPFTHSDATVDTDLLIEGRAAFDTLETAFTGEFFERHHRALSGLTFNWVSRRDELLLCYFAMDEWLRAPALSALDLNAWYLTPEVREPDARALEARATQALGHAPDAPTRRRFRARLRELLEHPLLRGQLPQAPPRTFEGETRIVDSRGSAGFRNPRLFRALSELMLSARSEIWVETPYLILGTDALEVLRRVGERGVRVHVLTNSPRSSDNALSQAFFLLDWPEIVAQVPHLQLYALDQDRLLHSKRIVIDGELSVIGTYNFDPLSAYMNSEVVAAVWSREFAAHNLVEMQGRVARREVVEYRIARDDEGKALRRSRGRGRRGRVVVRYGHRDHCAPSRYREAEELIGLVALARRLPPLHALVPPP